MSAADSPVALSDAPTANIKVVYAPTRFVHPCRWINRGGKSDHLRGWSQEDLLSTRAVLTQGRSAYRKDGREPERKPVPLTERGAKLGAPRQGARPEGAPALTISEKNARAYARRVGRPVEEFTGQPELPTPRSQDEERLLRQIDAEMKRRRDLDQTAPAGPRRSHKRKPRVRSLDSRPRDDNNRRLVRDERRAALGLPIRTFDPSLVPARFRLDSYLSPFPPLTPLPRATLLQNISDPEEKKRKRTAQIGHLMAQKCRPLRRAWRRLRRDPDGLAEVLARTGASTLQALKTAIYLNRRLPTDLYVTDWKVVEKAMALQVAYDLAHPELPRASEQRDEARPSPDRNRRRALPRPMPVRTLAYPVPAPVRLTRKDVEHSNWRARGRPS